jgi:hypothetical protein
MTSCEGPASPETLQGRETVLNEVDLGGEGTDALNPESVEHGVEAAIDAGHTVCS